MQMTTQIFPQPTLPGFLFSFSANGPDSSSEDISGFPFKKGHPTIMLVEDDAFDSMVVKRALVTLDAKYNIDWQQESWKAIDKLIHSKKEDLPDMILLDLKMPRIDGFQFLQELREHSHLKDLPVVVVSTSSENEDKNRAYSFGVKNYVVKSFDFKDFVDQLRSLL